MVQAARGGQVITYSDGRVERISPARIRAEALRAHRKHEARMLAGHEDEMSVEAEAGAILEAETAVEIHNLHEIAQAWAEANKK